MKEATLTAEERDRVAFLLCAAHLENRGWRIEDGAGTAEIVATDSDGERVVVACRSSDAGDGFAEEPDPAEGRRALLRHFPATRCDVVTVSIHSDTAAALEHLFGVSCTG